VKAVSSDERKTKNPSRTDIRRELDDMANHRSSPELRQELRRVMRERRGPVYKDVTKYDYLPVDEGWDTLLVTDGLLIAKESFDRAQSDLSELHLKRAALGCAHLDGEVLKLTHREGRPLTASGLAHLARTLRRRGFSAALTTAVVTGPVGKGHRGPGPARARKLSLPAKPKGPKVAIIDTGISRQRRSTVSKRSKEDELHQFPRGNSRKDRVERAKYLSLAAGHGTFVTGIVQQLAPDADITVYRALNSDGIGSCPRRDRYAWNAG
jgi:hypothetical protein